MKFFGGLLGVAVAAGMGVGYYAYRRHCDTGQGYLDIVKQLPGEVQRRATAAVHEGRAAAKRRDEEIRRELAAGPDSVSPQMSTYGAAAMPPTPGSPQAGADGTPFSTPVSAVS